MIALGGSHQHDVDYVGNEEFQTDLRYALN